MKSLPLFLIVFTLFIVSCGEKYYEHPDYILTAEQIGYEKKLNRDGSWSHFFEVEFNLNAKRDSLCPIYLMTCSWGARNAITSDSDFPLGAHLCESNFLTYVDLGSDEYLKLFSVIGRYDDFNDKEVKRIRAGIVKVDTCEMAIRDIVLEEGGDELFDQLIRRKREVIWSNEFELKKMNKTIEHTAGWRHFDLNGNRIH